MKYDSKESKGFFYLEHPSKIFYGANHFQSPDLKLRWKILKVIGPAKVHKITDGVVATEGWAPHEPSPVREYYNVITENGLELLIYFSPIEQAFYLQGTRRVYEKANHNSIQEANYKISSNPSVDLKSSSRTVFNGSHTLQFSSSQLMES